MKIISFFLTLVWCSLNTSAQIVNIPDAAFKSFLIGTQYVDMNHDNEIQVSEAAGTYFLNITGSNITDLTGLEAFINLTSLSILETAVTNVDVSMIPNLDVFICNRNNSLTSLNVSNLTLLTHLECYENDLNALDLSTLTNNLEYLECHTNNLTSLNVNHLTGLTYLKCSQNNLTSLNVSNLVNLQKLLFYYNNITSIDVSHCTNLIMLSTDRNPLHTLDVSALVHLNYLSCSETELTTLDVTHNPNLLNLHCKMNQLTEINLSNQTRLVEGDFSNNLFSALDFSHTSLIGPNEYLFISENPLLEYVNLKNGRPSGGVLNCYSCPNLRFVCADDNNIVFVQNQLQNNPNIQVNSYCSFVPGGTNNVITGTLTYDADNNGCDAFDPHVPANVKMGIVSGSQSGAGFTNIDGKYTFYSQNFGTHTVAPVIENNYFTVSPAAANFDFEFINGSTQTQNFCLTPVGVHYDVEIVLIPYTNARPGFDATYKIVYKNKGNQILSGVIDFAFDDAILNFVSANPTISNQSLNHLNWNYSNLLPFESRMITVVLNLNSPQEIPAVNLGDVLSYTATMTNNGQDDVPADNTFHLNQTVTGSFDPNDKTCLEGNTIPLEKVGDYLHYMIRFQNTGTEYAENVVIRDIIDATKFDVNSLQLIATSHTMKTKINGQKVEFFFEAINLPAVGVNEPGSHGFVTFKIKTKNDLVVGNSVNNTANIYFDYNFPVITNTTNTTVALLGMNQLENTTVKITPNPVKNLLKVTAKDNITSVQLIDVQGRVLETMTANDTVVNFDLSQKSKAIYFVKVYTAKGMKVEKIIKE